MATGKITKRSLDSLRANGVSGFLWDEELKGFGVRMTASGSASYIVQYRLGGREAKTRREAERLLMLVAQGTDPVEADKERRREAVDLAFLNYADRFAASCRGNGWRTLVQRSLRLYLKPALSNKPLPKITRADVVAVFDRMPDEQVANRRNVFAVLRRLLRWAVSRGDLQNSPMEGMETPPPVKPRERWLVMQRSGASGSKRPIVTAASALLSAFYWLRDSGVRR